MNPEEIKLKLQLLAKDHDEAKDDLLAEMLEEAAEKIIVSYCESKHYQINGFPFVKRKIVPEEEQDDYFSRERFQRYLYLLIPRQHDVAELMFLYESLFYAGMPDILEDYILEVKEMITGYDIDIDLD